MSIDFSSQRWSQVKETYRRWWAGELDRPIISAVLRGRDPGRPMPTAPLLSQATCHDLSVPAEALVDRLDWELGTRVFLGDAFPVINMDCFGPGIAATFAGARLDNSTGRVWFHPPREVPISELHLDYNPNSPWLLRIKDLCAAMMKRWQGQVLVTMTDLGGNLDILSTFRPSEQLLLDLYDEPDQLQRVLAEAHDLWHRAFADINAVLQPVNPGYSAWCGIYSDQPYYMLQCDFSYMIGPAMFETFARPELEATTRRLARSFYHLDGRGELPHLDSLLSLPELDGVQWVPGDGQPPAAEWPEVYERILLAGKKAQVMGGGRSLETVEKLLKRCGLGAGVHCRWWDQPLSAEPELRAWVQRLCERAYPRTVGASTDAALPSVAAAP